MAKTTTKKVEFDGSIIKSAVASVFEKVNAGEAPDEIVNFCESMSLDNVKFWLHGFFMAICKQKVLRKSILYRFLKEQMV